MQPTLVIDAVGLTWNQLGEETPHLCALRDRGAGSPMSAILPAVTCSAQATMLTGQMPSVHGAVGNGWLARDTFEIALWRQSNQLVEAPKVYDTARGLDPTFTCAKLFWWWNMGADVDWSITPRPFYPADGRKIPATYSWPTEFGQTLKYLLGSFPFFDFWGPKAGLPSSRWIADATLHTLRSETPSLTLAYLPHLDYDHQRHGPHDPRSKQALRELDELIGDLVAGADEVGAETLVVSEYGILPVQQPVHINRILSQAGLLVARATPNGRVLDPFGSRAFAVADHQLAHIYTPDPTAREEVLEVLHGVPGIEQVLDSEGKRAAGLDHPNAGDLVAVSTSDAWFTYYYWDNPADEPDFARTVDIHRKPGYDPCEMFLDPSIRFPKLRVARRLAQKLLGMRYLMDVIPVNADLIRGSHGRLPDDPGDGPIFLSSLPFGELNPEPEGGVVPMTSVHDRILGSLKRPAQGAP